MGVRPRIGITMRIEIEGGRYSVSKHYGKWVLQNGGIPFHIGAIEEKACAKEIVAGLDGLILTGSNTDIDPIHFNEDPIPAFGRCIVEKDTSDFLLIREAFEKGIPILGICFGMQSLNVYCGGSLYQDIQQQISDSLQHSQGKPDDWSSHGIEIEGDSLLYDIAGRHNVRVNSHHHQSVKQVGDSLICSARAADGVIECIEGVDSNRFVLGVQWHPEMAKSSDPLANEIFKRFVSAC